MLPLMGPWIDTAEFTDVDLLVDIARSSRSAAVGVLANRNLTGDHLAGVAASADLSAANVEAMHDGNLLVGGRTVEDQQAILLAALEKSEAAAARMLPHLAPETLRRLLLRARTTRFKGAAALAEKIENTVNSADFAARSHEPAFLELLDTVDDNPRPGDGKWRTLRAAAHFGDRDGLLALTEHLASFAADGHGPTLEPDVETLLLCSYGHPDVVRHWGEHGGLIGRHIAIRDHRQDPDWLLALDAEHPGDGLTDQLVLNPTVPYEARARIRARLFEQLLSDDLPNGPGRARTMGGEAAALLESRFRFDGVDVSTHAGLDETGPLLVSRLANAGGLTSLLTYELLLHVDINGSLRGNLGQSILGSLYPVGQVLVALSPLVNQGVHHQQILLLRAADQTRRGDQTVDADPTVNTFLGGILCHQGHHVARYRGAAPVAQLRTLEGLKTLYERIDTIRGDRNQGYGTHVQLAGVLNGVLAETRAADQANAAKQAMAELFPSALGAL